jgi:hypothetical protein
MSGRGIILSPLNLAHPLNFGAHVFTPPAPVESYGVHTSQLSTLEDIDPPQPPLRKGGESIKLSSSPFLRGIEGDL